MAYQLTTSVTLSSAQTGLTLRAQLVDTSGVNSGSEITTGFSEIGNGFYLWNYSSFADDFRGGVKIYESGATTPVLAFRAINPEEGEYTDVKTSTRSDFDNSTETVDIGSISGSATAANNLEASALGIVVGAAATGTLSTTQMTTNLTESTDDHYVGRVVLWTSGVLSGQAAAISDYAGSTKLISFSARTDAPSNGDSFVIL